MRKLYIFTGDTYNNKEEIKKTGAKWNGENKVWETDKEVTNIIPNVEIITKYIPENQEEFKKIIEILFTEEKIYDFIEKDFKNYMLQNKIDKTIAQMIKDYNQISPKTSASNYVRRIIEKNIIIEKQFNLEILKEKCVELENYILSF